MSATITAEGPFEVKTLPLPADGPEPAIGRLALDKRFEGPLQAHSKGQMLGFRSATDGSAGYVALEKVDGRLHGRSGTFLLQHSGSMDRGNMALAIQVVPDSADGDLLGLRGTMQIRIASDGAHRYEFTYTLPTRAAD